MCKNEAMANRILACIVQHGIDNDTGGLDLEKTKAILMQCLVALNLGAEDEEEDAL